QAPDRTMVMTVATRRGPSMTRRDHTDPWLILFALGVGLVQAACSASVTPSAVSTASPSTPSASTIAPSPIASIGSSQPQASLSPDSSADVLFGDSATADELTVTEASRKVEGQATIRD